MEDDRESRLAKLKRETERLRAQNDAAVEETRVALDRLEQTIQRSEDAGKSDTSA